MSKGAPLKDIYADVPVPSSVNSPSSPSAHKDTLIEGYLHKKSPSSIMGMHRWQKRWFILTKDAVHYYKNRLMKKLQGNQTRAKYPLILLSLQARFPLIK